MYLHKYKKGNKTFYGITELKRGPGEVVLSNDFITDSVPLRGAIETSIGNLNGIIDEMKTAPKEEKPKEEKPKEEKPKEEKPEEPEKTAVSDVIRKYARIMDSLNKD